jgi:hypothetical protein
MNLYQSPHHQLINEMARSYSEVLTYHVDPVKESRPKQQIQAANVTKHSNKALAV